MRPGDRPPGRLPFAAEVVDEVGDFFEGDEGDEGDEDGGNEEA
ncbi:hypothetical protein [Streptomyces sp. NPDC089799]